MNDKNGDATLNPEQQIMDALHRMQVCFSNSDEEYMKGNFDEVEEWDSKERKARLDFMDALRTFIDERISQQTAKL